MQFHNCSEPLPNPVSRRKTMAERVRIRGNTILDVSYSLPHMAKINENTKNDPSKKIKT